MRRLVVCADGTWHGPGSTATEFDPRKPTNVAKISRSVTPIDAFGISQIVYYDAGIGTYNSYDSLIGGATGKGISSDIIEAYSFLMNNFAVGDEVFLFGFSRGAYTVRSLTGLIHVIGLLPKGHDCWLPKAFEFYRSTKGEDEKQKYRERNGSVDVQIKMIGVWDTVGGLGIPDEFLDVLTRQRHRFHDVTLSPIVSNAFHALAIDEHHEALAPALWDKKLLPHQVVEQAWFPGVHSNLGGGCKNDGLANCALHWIGEKARQLGLGIDQDYLDRFIPDPEGKLYESRKGIDRFAEKYPRTIGATKHGEEFVHEAALLRWESKRLKKENLYRPGNLWRYLNSHGYQVTK